MSNTVLPVQWTAGADLIQHPPRRPIVDHALLENSFSKNLAFQLPIFNGLLVRPIGDRNGATDCLGDDARMGTMHCDASP